MPINNGYLSLATKEDIDCKIATKMKGPSMRAIADIETPIIVSNGMMKLQYSYVDAAHPSGDGVHPNGIGYGLMRSPIRARIDAMLA